MLLIGLIFYSFFISAALSLDIYNIFPESKTSYCSRQLSVDSQTGCSSNFLSSSGIVVPVNDAKLVNFLNNSNEQVIVVMKQSVFLNHSLMNSLREQASVSGIVVFSVSSLPTNVSPFSENSFCPNGKFNFYENISRECDTTPKWNPPAQNYATISWPFPIVLVSDNNGSLWNATLTCFDELNKRGTDDTRCSMDIRNFMSGIGSSQLCYQREVLLSYRLDAPPTLCSQLGGVNFMMRGLPTPADVVSNNRLPSSTLVVTTRTDSRSMFDRKASSSLGVLPGVAVLTSVANHLMNTPAFKSFALKKDVLFVFLDNEAYDFMGSQRFLFDLVNLRIASHSGAPFSIESIESILELSEIGLPHSIAGISSYFLMSDTEIAEQTKPVTSSIWNALNRSATLLGGVQFQNASEFRSDVPLPPTASLQAILTRYKHLKRPLSHTVVFDRAEPPFANQWMDSFIDTRWPPANNPNINKTLLELANVIARAIYIEVVNSTDQMPPISSVTPGELMYCFVQNPGCDLLRLHLDPDVVNFLMSLGGPIPTQNYHPIEGREFRVSHVVGNLLMGLTGERLKDCPPSNERGVYTYLYGYFNGTRWCYRSLVDTSTSFSLFENNKVASPGWARSAIFGNSRYLRMYRSASRYFDDIAIAVGVMLTLITGMVGVLVQAYAKILFPNTHDPHLLDVISFSL